MVECRISKWQLVPRNREQSAINFEASQDQVISELASHFTIDDSRLLPL